MNKKQLLIAAVAAMLSVTSVYADSNISGIEGVPGAPGGGNIFNISPDKVNGDVGFRHYENFQLGKDDIANLIYKLGVKDIESFINLVDNKIDIQGIVNTMRDGNFYNGHAIFVSPNGMVVGASGVLNVGSLSVVTPQQGTYDALKGEYAVNNFDNIAEVSKLKQDGNAPISIEGTVLARNGIDLRGTAIDISGNVLNGLTEMNQITETARAEELFNQLVNTDGLTSSANAIDNGSLILVKSSDKTGAGITVSGKVANLGDKIVYGGDADSSGVSSGIFLTNEGEKGINVEENAVIASNNRVQLYNKKGDLTVNGKVSNKNDLLVVTNRENGGKLEIGSTGKLTTGNELAVSNKGTGALTIAGTTSSVGKTDITNYGAGGMEIAGDIGDDKVDNVRIVNYNGKMTFTTDSNVNAEKVLQVENRGEGGLEIQQDANLASKENLGLKNKAGEMIINGVVGVEEGDMNVWNYENATGLTLASNGKINGNGALSIKNTGSNGMTLNGTITNGAAGEPKETAINNTAGKLTLNGTITNEGNMGIINKENGTGLDILQNADITNKGDLKIVNSSGAEGLTVVGDVENTGNMRVYNENGHLTVANNSGLTKQGSLTNHDGYMYIFSRNNSTGITTQQNTNISNENGSLAIKHNGTTTAGEDGMHLEGNIANSNADTAINNYSGDMYVSGHINVTDSNLGIVNNAGGGEVMFANNSNENSTITSTGTGDMNIKNYGSGDMTVNNEITHEGRLNILGNTNHLYLGGKIHNNGGDYTYAASRENGTGLTASSNFKVDGSGNILIKNITGSDGLEFNGTIENTNGEQTALVNHKGDMTVTGDIANTGSSVIISNKGDGLTVTENSQISNDQTVKIVNTGTKEAQINGKVQAPEGQYRFIEKIKELLNLN